MIVLARILLVHHRQVVYIEFEGLEVDTVREAYIEYIFRAISLGNDSRVSKHHKGIAEWEQPKQNYIGASNPLVTILQEFSDNTVDRVDEIIEADSTLNPIWQKAAGKRIELGQSAAHLALGIEFHSTIDRELKELLG